MSRRLKLLALAALGSLAGAAPASAGSCCECASPCSAPMLQVAPNAYYSATQFYIVNEAPTYTGPGILTLPPNYYPYVGGGCCGGGQYRGTSYQQVMPYQEIMPYQGEGYEDGSSIGQPELGFQYRSTRWHRRDVVHHRRMRMRGERVVTREREAPFHPGRRRPFDPRDK